LIYFSDKDECIVSKIKRKILYLNLFNNKYLNK